MWRPSEQSIAIPAKGLRRASTSFVTGPSADLHSGTPRPARFSALLHVVAEILASLH